MRGLGIGILVTAVLMSVTLHGRTKPMSDEEVIARAKELGMEETGGNSVLADAVSENTFASQEETQKEPETEMQDATATEKQNEVKPETPDESDAVREDRTVAPEAETDREEEPEQKSDVPLPEKPETEESEAEKPGDGQSVGQTEEQQEEQQKEQQEESSEAQPASGSVEITVNSGDGSLTVAKKLVQAGLVDDAAEFDRFLCQNGYDKRICTGVHSFAKGASDEEIAKELTRKGK